MTSSWVFLSTLNYDARSTTHQIDGSNEERQKEKEIKKIKEKRERISRRIKKKNLYDFQSDNVK